MRLLPVFLALCLSSLGCGGASGMGRGDEAYIASIAENGDAEILRNMNSERGGDRRAALMALAERAREARLGRDRGAADRMADILVRRYFEDRDPGVRFFIVAVCAPVAGSGSNRVVRFLRERIARGEYAGDAALSLAVLKPPGAFGHIAPLVRHPAPEIRYWAATALTVLGDPRGYEPALWVWRSMGRPNWPEKLSGVPVSEMRDELAARIGRYFGRPVF